MGYVTYVFALLDDEDKKLLKENYIMCVRYPNWQHEDVKYNVPGYLNFIEVLAGIDKYYNGAEMVPYNYTNVQFIKFVEEPKPTLIDKNIILD